MRIIMDLAIIALIAFYIFVTNQPKRMVCIEDPYSTNNKQTCIITNTLGK